MNVNVLRTISKISKILIVACSFTVLYQLCETTMSHQINNFVDAKNITKPSTTLTHLFAILGLPHDGTLLGMNTVAQQPNNGMLRQPGKERWEVTSPLEEKRAIIMPILEQLGMINEMTTSQKNFDYALLCGCTKAKFKERIKHLEELWQSGIRFKEMVILGGARTLIDIERSEHHADNEAAMMWYEYQQSKLANLPVVVTLVDTPMQQNNDGTFRRPSIDDTIRTWLAKEPTPGSCLAVTNQPYAVRAHLGVSALLPANFTCVTVGKKAIENERISTYLDECARTIYQLVKNQK